MRAGMSTAILLGLALLTASAEGRPATPEYEVKAAFIYNFTKFVDWPSPERSERGRLELCILGNDPFGSAIGVLAGREVQGREIEIRRPNTIEETRTCQLVYVSRSESPRMPDVLSELRDSRGVLLVSDIPRFAADGGTIELRIVDNRVRFAINLAAAERAQIEISSHLLRLAIDVIPTRDEK